MKRENDWHDSLFPVSPISCTLILLPDSYPFYPKGKFTAGSRKQKATFSPIDRDGFSTYNEIRSRKKTEKTGGHPMKYTLYRSFGNLDNDVRKHELAAVEYAPDIYAATDALVRAVADDLAGMPEYAPGARPLPLRRSLCSPTAR